MAKDIFKDLCAPFPTDAVSWRVGNTNKKAIARQTGDQNARPTKGVALVYITARDVMDRLDEVVGPANWQDAYETHGARTICRLSLRVDGEWITKADGAGDTDVEAEKGSISDALKRAAVKWGIGRYLYDVPSLWVELDQYGQIAKHEYDRLRKILPAKIEGEKEAPAQETPFDAEPTILPASIEPNDEFQQRIADTLIAAINTADGSYDLADWLSGGDTRRTISDLPSDLSGVVWRAVADKLIHHLQMTETASGITGWGENEKTKRTIADLPKDQADRVRVAYTAHRAALTKKTKEAA